MRLPTASPIDALRRASPRGRWQTLARRLAAPPAASALQLGGSAAVNVQVWLGQFPWRPTAGWAALAAALAAGAGAGPTALTWPTLVLLLLLVDPLWGSLWRMAAGRKELLPVQSRIEAERVWLPYMEPGSPAALLFEGDMSGALPALVRVALPSLLLALVVASALGVAAVVGTVVLALVAAAGWISLRSLGRTPFFLHSLVVVGLPWLLALLSAGVEPGAPGWATRLGVGAAWTVHIWGGARLLEDGRDLLGKGLLVAAQATVALLLVAARAPLWLAVLLVLWSPAWFYMLRGRPMRGLQFWWLLALLVSGMALGQSV